MLETRNQFRISVAEIHEQSRSTQQKLDTLAQESSVHNSNIGREAAETTELQDAIGKLSKQKDQSAKVKERLSMEIRQIREEVEVRKREQRLYDESLEEQRRLNSPELRFWTENLGMKIEACENASSKSRKTDTDRLKIVFTHVDEAQWEKECWFELEMSAGSNGGYNVGMSKPKLEREEVERVLEVMNATSNLARFFGGMRSLFVKVVKDSR